MKVTIKSKADKVAMWFLIIIGLVHVFLYTMAFSYGFVRGLLSI